MARAREIPNLSATDSFADAAAKVVAVRASELFEHSSGVLDTADIERVHDMRVASRRLRAVLEVFAPCFPKGPRKRALREIKALADALGERRDADVHIAAFEAYAAAVPEPDRPGVESLLASLRIEQAQANERLSAALEAAERADLRGLLSELAGVHA